MFFRAFAQGWVMDYILYFEYASCMLMIVLICAYLAGRSMDTYQNKMLLTLFSTNIITSLIDLANYFIPKISFPRNEIAAEISHTLYFVFHVGTVIAFYLYCNALSGNIKRQSKLFRRLMLVPAALCYIIVIINPFTHLLFSVDDNANYHREPLIALFYAAAVFYLMAAVITVCFPYTKLAVLKKMTCILFFVANLICAGVQFVQPRLLIETFGVALSLVLIYIVFEHPQEYVDSKYNSLNVKGFGCFVDNCVNTNTDFMLFCIKIHELNGIQKAFGEEYTDELLRSMVRRMYEEFPKANFFKLSYSTFVLTVRGNDEERYAKTKSKLIEMFSGVWEVGDSHMKLKASIGCAYCMKELSTAEDISDFIGAVKRSSSSFKNMTADAADVDTESIRRRRKLKDIVSDAAEHGGFEVFYQPIVSASDGRIITAEALIRLKHCELGYVSPEEFIPIAEEQGSIIRIGEFVFRSVCRFIREKNLIERGLRYIEINLSAVQCLQNNLSETLSKIMSSYDLKPSYINLEITETSEAILNSTFHDNISALSNMGIGFSMDDYGTGFSNMNYLFKLPFDIVKIDKSILWEAFTNERAMIVLENIICLAHRMGLEVVAEGVETHEHIEQLRKFNCEYLQGYFFSRPVSEKEFDEVLRTLPFMKKLAAEA